MTWDMALDVHQALLGMGISHSIDVGCHPARQPYPSCTVTVVPIGMTHQRLRAILNMAEHKGLEVHIGGFSNSGIVIGDPAQQPLIQHTDARA